MEPTGLHEQVAGFVGRKLNVEIDQRYSDYFIHYPNLAAEQQYYLIATRIL